MERGQIVLGVTPRVERFAEQMPRLPRRPAAVDEDVRAGVEACLLRAEEERELPDVLHTPPAPERNLRNENLGEFQIVGERRADLGDVTWVFVRSIRTKAASRP